MADIGTWLDTMLNGRLAGKDQFGNRYYEAKRAAPRKSSIGRKRRWVLYKGLNEASKVPPNWHAWLHHYCQEPPQKEEERHYAWQQEHIPNLSGTTLAYHPPGHPAKGGKRPASGGDYEAWRP